MADPRSYSVADTLRSGVAVTIRALRDDDRDRMARAIRGLDRESIYTRFFAYRKPADDLLDRAMRFDADTEVVLVVTTGVDAGETIVAAGRYIVTGGPEGALTAEVAFMVEEDFHGLGIAGRLLRHLASIARDRGIAAFEAEVLAGNKAMLAVFARSGLPMRTAHEDGIVRVTLALRDGPD